MANKNKINNGTNNCRIACAIIFVAFSFDYLYYYQADVLSAAQHIASGGKTYYSQRLGTALIVLGLIIIQIGVQAIAKLKGAYYALTYLPSFLVLMVLTAIPSDFSSHYDIGALRFVLPIVLLIIWVAIVYFVRQYQSVDSKIRSKGLLSQAMGINLTILLGMMLLTCFTGNHNRLFHERMHVESLIIHKKFDEAVKSVENSHSTDNTLRMLRAYALAKQHKIGNCLFSYTMIGQKSIIPYSSNMTTVIIPQKQIIDYYKRNIDWQLSELLVKKDVEEFTVKLKDSYELGIDTIKDSKKDKSYRDSLLQQRIKRLPKYYKEALVIFESKHSNAKHTSLNKELLDDYHMFDSLKLSDAKDKYMGTYWIYYRLKMR